MKLPAKLILLMMTLFLALGLPTRASAQDGGVIIYPGKEAGPVVFSHAAHGKKSASRSCKECHRDGGGRKLDISMEGIRQGKACGACHSRSATAFAADQCSSCHMPAKDIVFKLNRMDPVRFSHVNHLAATGANKTSIARGFSCGDCHPVPFDRSSGGSIGMAVPHETDACAHCHNGKKQNGRLIFAATSRCLTCHKK